MNYTPSATITQYIQPVEQPADQPIKAPSRPLKANGTAELQQQREQHHGPAASNLTPIKRSFMPTPLPFPRDLSSLLRTLFLVAAVSASMSAAHADDYTDVSTLLRAGKSAEAMAKAEQYLTSKPRDPQMRFLKGVIQTETGKTSDAIATFTKITEDYPELPEPYNNLAVLYAGQSQFDKARTALEMAIRINPGYATAHENLGDVYVRLAGQSYAKAQQLDAGNPGLSPKLTMVRQLLASSAKTR